MSLNSMEEGLKNSIEEGLEEQGDNMRVIEEGLEDAGDRRVMDDGLELVGVTSICMNEEDECLRKSLGTVSSCSSCSCSFSSFVCLPPLFHPCSALPQRRCPLRGC